MLPARGFLGTLTQDLHRRSSVSAAHWTCRLCRRARLRSDAPAALPELEAGKLLAFSEHRARRSQGLLVELLRDPHHGRELTVGAEEAGEWDAASDAAGAPVTPQ